MVYKQLRIGLRQMNTIFNVELGKSQTFEGPQWWIEIDDHLIWKQMSGTDTYEWVDGVLAYPGDTLCLVVFDSGDLYLEKNQELFKLFAHCNLKSNIFPFISQGSEDSIKILSWDYSEVENDESREANTEESSTSWSNSEQTVIEFNQSLCQTTEEL